MADINLGNDYSVSDASSINDSIKTSSDSKSSSSFLVKKNPKKFMTLQSLQPVLEAAHNLERASIKEARDVDLIKKLNTLNKSQKEADLLDNDACFDNLIV